MVTEEIAESIKSCKYFSIQADVTRTEQLSLIRFFDDTSSTIEECFISFTPMLMLGATSITDYILNTLETLGLDHKSSHCIRFRWSISYEGSIEQCSKTHPR